jgi:hypothetical protein
VKANCTLDTTGWSLWLSFPDEATTVRLRHTGALPQEFAKLDGKTVDLAEVLQMLPPLAFPDFRTGRSSMPEYKARVADWQISVVLPATGRLGERAVLAVQIEEWVRTHLTP